MPWARNAYTALAAVMLAMVVVQFFAAGLGAFGASDYDFHRTFAGPLHAPAFLMIIAGALGKMGKLFWILPIVLLVLISGQYGLADARGDAPEVAALHPVVALAIFAITHMLLQRSRALDPTVNRTAA